VGECPDEALSLIRLFPLSVMPACTIAAKSASGDAA